MREGAAGRSLSTAAWHICQIRGISPARERGIREDRDSHLSHERRASVKKNKPIRACGYFPNMSPGVKKEKSV